ncbi:MAG: flagellar basal body L-ring protein FlgH [Aeromicrobium sp.]|nr:flagellar basal body L-ring protein FlgH [Burkholderiales bacterium]
MQLLYSQLTRRHHPGDEDELFSVWQVLFRASIILMFSLVVFSLITGCSHIEPRVEIVMPTTSAPRQEVHVPVINGAIFQTVNAPRPLFEDQKPGRVGDILTVAIVEKTSASRSSKSSSAKTSDTKAAVPALAGLPGKSFLSAQLAANAANTFEGKGETANDNTFTGTLTVTVVSVLPNGNLVVAGEKQIGINHNTESIRFSGVVNPLTIQAGNVVQSPQVADARLEYRGKGYIDEAQRMGWLQRFFLNAFPF